MSAARDQLGIYLGALYGAAPADSYIEARYRRPDGPGMAQQFTSAKPEPGFIDWILATGEETDLYLGVAPRSEKRGGRDAIERAHALWVDADSPQSIEALGRFTPAPAIIVHSGNGRHAYWPLYPPLSADHVERANRRLAYALEADSRSTDAARILRPPGTFNHKGGAPVPVEIERLEVEVFTAREVVGDLADPPGPASRSAQRSPRDAGPDALLSIPPTIYVPAFTSRALGVDGKICCPLHEDRTPSLHAYPTAEQGWTCFGCGRGGSIYDLASALSGIGTRGRDFKRLRGWIGERLLNAPLEVAA